MREHTSITRRLSAILVVLATVVAGAVVPGDPAGAATAPSLGRIAVRQNASTTDRRVWDNADPAVLVDGGVTYLYGSSNNRKVPVRRVTSYSATVASTRAAWNAGSVDAMPTRPPWVNPAKWQIWAPSVVKIGSSYYLYFASMHKDARVDTRNDQCIGRAVGSSPMGPFTPFNSPLYCGLPAEAGSNSFGRGALDPEVFRAPNGALHMLVALTRTTANIGVVDLTSTGAVVGGRNARPTILVRQSLPWHDGSDNTTLTAANGFLENPSMIYNTHTRTYLLFYSAGQWATPRYVTGFARCATPKGPCRVDTRGPFLKGGPTRTAPGGLTVFRGPDNKPRVAYATWTRGREAVADPTGASSRQTHFALLHTSAVPTASSQVIELRAP